MGLVIKSGHLIDPANGVDGQKDLYIDDNGFVIGVGKAPPGFKAKKTHRRARQDRLSGPRGFARAPARTGPRAQGHD